MCYGKEDWADATEHTCVEQCWGFMRVSLLLTSTDHKVHVQLRIFKKSESVARKRKDNHNLV